MLTPFFTAIHRDLKNSDGWSSMMVPMTRADGNHIRRRSKGYGGGRAGADTGDGRQSIDLGVSRAMGVPQMDGL